MKTSLATFTALAEFYCGSDFCLKNVVKFDQNFFFLFYLNMLYLGMEVEPVISEQIIEYLPHNIGK